MGNNAVKNIVLLMVLVVLSFIVGAQVSDNVKESVGAFVIIAVIIGGGFLVYLGPRVWQLLFVLPPFIELLPLPRVGHAIMQCGIAPFFVATVVMLYWIVMWSVGRAHIRWRWAGVLDIPFLVFVGFLVIAYIRFPVALNVMGLDYDAIGGEEVVILFFMLTHYICLSMIPVTKQDLEKVLPLAFKFFIVASLLMLVQVKVMGGQAMGDADVGASHVTRFFALYPLGSTLFFWMYSKYPMGKIITSFRCWMITVFAAVSVMATGQRQNMALLAMGIVYIACIKREIIVFILAVMGAYIGVLYLGEMDMLALMPNSAQRTLSSVPGIKVDETMIRSGAGTMETRRQVWTYAMNPHTGVIKDYLWGDGFALSRAYLERENVAEMRGTGGGTEDNEAMTVSRNFHNGAIHTISRIGYVGLAWCAVMCCIAWAVSIQVLRVWYRTDTYPYIVIGVINIPIIMLTYGYANYTTKNFMYSLQSYFFLKLCYCIARENGLLRPLLLPQHYVPLMIQEAEQTRTTA